MRPKPPRERDRTVGGIDDIKPPPAPFDEATHDDGSPRPPYQPLLAALDDADLPALERDLAAALADAGVVFGEPDTPFRVDLVPRVLDAALWRDLEAGLIQRTRALDAFAHDAYGARRIVSEGVLEAQALGTAEYHEPMSRDPLSDGRHWITIAGLDLVRGPDGGFRVLEDNVRTPSGLGYLLAAGAVVRASVPAGDLQPAPLEPSVEAFGAALCAAAPPGRDDPAVVVLTDGPGNTAYWEHRHLAGLLGVPLVRPVDLRRRGPDLVAATDDGEVRVDVVYRRTDEDRVAAPRGGVTGLADQLLEPWQRGAIGLVNAFGSGVADDKLLHAHVEDMIRFYLSEEPLLPSVETWDLNEPGVLSRALDDLPRLVVKPRSGHGGEGVLLGPHAGTAELDRAREALRANPNAWVVQELMPLSVHPTLCGGVLAPRHVDLRPFVILGAGDDAHVVPGGLTRVAFAEGEMIVNSSREGGAKDTWVV